MGKTDEQSFANVWDINVSKYNADSDEGVEEVVVEATAEDGSEAETVNQDPPQEEEGKENDVSTVTPNSDAGEGSDAEQDGDGKQAAEEETPSAEGKEDAPSGDQKQEPEATLEGDEVLYEGIMQGLVDDNVIEIEEEGRDVSFNKDGLKELITETVEKKSTEAVAKFKDDLGDEAKNLLGILEKGGSVDDYVKMSQQVDFAEVQLEDKDGNDLKNIQSYLVEDWMKVQGYEQEEIEETINDYLEGGLLKKQATIAKKKLTKWQTEQNNALLAQKEKEQQEAAQAEAQEAEAFKETVTTTREIAGFKVTEAKAKKLYDFITKKDKEGKSEFDRKDTAENRLLYAYFAMEGFDKDKLSKEIATKQSRTLRKKIDQFTDRNTKPKRGGGEQVKRDNQKTPKINWNFGA